MTANVAKSRQVEANPAGEDILRVGFVEILFALAASQVAIHAADLEGISAPLQDKMPAVAHLVVGSVLIVASWLGWRQSVSPGMKEKVKYLFSVPFIGLLVDVLLVILYFIIVRNVEIEQGGGQPVLAPPTAQPESRWLYVVFGVYAFWDLVEDVFSADCIPRAPFFSRVWKGLRTAFVSTFTSIVCLLLSLLVFAVATRGAKTQHVLFLDGALVTVILLFRVIKASENVLAPLLRVTDCKAFKEPRPTQSREPMWFILLIILYAVCLLGALDLQVEPILFG